MASFTGQNGALKISNVAVAELRGWSIDTTMSTIECSKMGDTARRYKKSLTDYTGSADIYVDLANYNTVQTSLDAGTPVAIEAFPASGGTGAAKITGNVILTGISITTSFDGMVEGTISFQGDGAVVFGTGV
jgi:predicted secreted protein